MFFRQVYDEGLAQASYLVGCERTGQALVVDPRRDIDVYTDLAGKHDLRISAVAETHIHADYLSGARELAAATGARLHLSAHGRSGEGYEAHQAEVDVALVSDGAVLDLGQVRARVRHTPGHTPEHICFEIFETGADAPMLMLSGDFFFVSDLGRPDLGEEALGKTGSAQSWARQMLSSLRQTVEELPDFLALWPAHGAGSACGKAQAAVPSTTLGYESRFAWWAPYARGGNDADFVTALLAGQSEAPAYFGRMKRENRGSVPLLRGLPDPPLLDATALRRVLGQGAVLVDTRNRDEFAAAHVSGALCIPDRESFSARCAWFLESQRPVVLLAHPERVNDLVRKLVRVGLDRIAGYVPTLAACGLPTTSLPQPDAQQVRRDAAADRICVLDVRSRGEFLEGHLPHAINVSAGMLAQDLASVPNDRPIVVMCAGGDRSVAAASVLCAAGFKDVRNLRGGILQWRQLGLPVESDTVPI